MNSFDKCIRHVYCRYHWTDSVHVIRYCVYYIKVVLSFARSFVVCRAKTKRTELLLNVLHCTAQVPQCRCEYEYRNGYLRDNLMVKNNDDDGSVVVVVDNSSKQHNRK